MKNSIEFIRWINKKYSLSGSSIKDLYDSIKWVGNIPVVTENNVPNTFIKKTNGISVPITTINTIKPTKKYGSLKGGFLLALTKFGSIIEKEIYGYLRSVNSAKSRKVLNDLLDGRVDPSFFIFEDKGVSDKVLNLEFPSLEFFDEGVVRTGERDAVYGIYDPIFGDSCYSHLNTNKPKKFIDGVNLYDKKIIYHENGDITSRHYIPLSLYIDIDRIYK